MHTKGIIFWALFISISAPLGASSRAAGDDAVILHLQDTIPPNNATRYTAWIDLTKTGTPQKPAHYQGTLRGITDSAFLFETPMPFVQTIAPKKQSFQLNGDNGSAENSYFDQPCFP